MHQDPGESSGDPIGDWTKTTNWSGHRQPFRKRIQNNDDEYTPWSRENNKEDARNVCQRPRKTEEQTEMTNTLEGINSKKTEAEERVNDPEDRIVEITAAEQNVEKRMKEMNTA